MSLKKLLEALNTNKNSRKDTAKKFAMGAGVGTFLGVIAGLLFAPKSGKETRSDIAKNAKKGFDSVKEVSEKACEKLSEIKKCNKNENKSE